MVNVTEEIKQFLANMQKLDKLLDSLPWDDSLVTAQSAMVDVRISLAEYVSRARA